MAGSFSFSISFILYAPPHQVFDALTNETLIKKWSNAAASFKLEKGAVYELFDGWATGEIISFDPGKELSYTWKTSNWNAKQPSSTVHILLSKNIAGTKVEIEHENLPNATESFKHKEGWVTFVLEPINDFFIDEMEKNPR